MRVESYSARDRLRLTCILGLVCGTTADQLRRILADLERVLVEHPKIWPDNVSVRFKEFGASSLNIEVTAWFQILDYNEFLLVRQEVLLSFMDVIQGAGSSLAFPTQTVHLVTDVPPKV
jgi:MscS family membrane protein